MDINSMDGEQTCTEEIKSQHPLLSANLKEV